MGPDASTDDYVKSSEAARILHVSIQTLARWAREGKLPYVITMGGHRRFSRAEMEELAKRQTRPGRLEAPPAGPDEAMPRSEDSSPTPEP